MKSQNTTSHTNGRMPKEADIEAVKQFIANYKMKNKKAGDREVKRAVIRKFNIELI